jgi:hypothetical protein
VARERELDEYSRRRGAADCLPRASPHSFITPNGQLGQPGSTCVCGPVRSSAVLPAEPDAGTGAVMSGSGPARVAVPNPYCECFHAKAIVRGWRSACAS